MGEDHLAPHFQRVVQYRQWLPKCQSRHLVKGSCSTLKIKCNCLTVKKVSCGYSKRNAKLQRFVNMLNILARHLKSTSCSTNKIALQTIIFLQSKSQFTIVEQED